MLIVTKVQLDIRGYAEETVTQLRQYLTKRYGYTYPEDPVVWDYSQDLVVASLKVVIEPDEVPDLANYLINWRRSRHLSFSITFESSIDGRSETAELPGQARKAEITRFLRTVSEIQPYSRESDSWAQIRFALTNELTDSGFRSTSLDLAAEELNASMMPVTIYLSDEVIHEQVERAVEALLATAGLQIEIRNDPIMGSWYRKMLVTIKKVAHSPAGREAKLISTHMVDTRLVLAQDATVTATMLQNLAPVLGALQPTKDAIIRAGALLIVKVEWTVHVYQLTAAQQAKLDHHSQLARSPSEIISALNLSPEGEQGDDHPEIT